MSRGSYWTDSEVSALISIWGEAGVQQQLDGATRNRAIFDKISKGMTDAGFKRNWKQCKDKSKNIKQDYKKIKDHNSITGNGRQTSKFFDRLDCILGHRPASAPTLVLQAGTTDVDHETCNAELSQNTNENTEGKLLYYHMSLY